MADRVTEAPANAPIQFPAKLKVLFERGGRWRYKVLKGGRGGAKSWGIARALLALGAAEPLRIACFREVQKNIKESVHQLLKDQIEGMGLSGFYEVLETEIRGKNGTLFLFAGLSGVTEAGIKSFEGVDIAWVEEAQAVRASSWKILIPTIRKANSEIWISMNPELETDPTYVMFVDTPRDDAVVVDINWRDNPWFPEVLERERLHAKATMKADEYNNVWGGRTRNAVQGAIYADEISEAMANEQITLVPHDPRLKVHVILDLGWNDSMFAILAQRHLSSIRAIEAIETDHTTLEELSGQLRGQRPDRDGRQTAHRRRYNFGKLWLPHDGAHGDFKTGKSTHQIARGMGWATGSVPSVPVETGIKRARSLIPMTYFDKQKTGPLTQALRRYKRNENPKTEEFGKPVHDAASHGADCYRYLALVADRLTNDDEMPQIPAGRVATYEIDSEMGM